MYSVGELGNVGTYSTSFIGNPALGGPPLDSNAHNFQMQMFNILSAMLSQTRYNAGSNNPMMANTMLYRHDPFVRAAGVGHKAPTGAEETCDSQEQYNHMGMSQQRSSPRGISNTEGMDENFLMACLRSKDDEINALKDKLNKMERARERSHTPQDATAEEDVSGRPQNQTNADVPESEHCLNQLAESQSQGTVTATVTVLEEEACEENAQRPIEQQNMEEGLLSFIEDDIDAQVPSRRTNFMDTDVVITSGC